MDRTVMADICRDWVASWEANRRVFVPASESGTHNEAFGSRKWRRCATEWGDRESVGEMECSVCWVTWV